MISKDELGFNQLLLIAVFAGLTIGASLFYITGNDGKSYCKNLESEIKQNKSFKGDIACYSDSKIDVNLSEKVENNSELKCVCKKAQDGKIQYLPITVTGS